MDTYQLLLLFAFSLLSAGLLAVVLSQRKQLKKLQAQLSEINGQSDEDMFGRAKMSELGVMSAGITHEISNPLSVIMGRVEVMLKKSETLDKEALNRGLEQIRTNGERISAIIQSVREYIYRNEETVEDFIPLKEIISNVLVFCGQRLKSHGIELRLNNVNNVYVSGHKGQFEQALLNLINNSFFAIDNLAEKWIEISAESSVDTVKIFIKDSGHGIPVEVRKKMLQPFFSTKKGNGTGLGLTLVRGIAKNHGGELKYIDAPNTTFLLELPQASSVAYHH